MRTELVSFRAADGHVLDALLYQPESPDNRPALVISHGRGMDFCVGAPRFLPPALVPQGYTCLSINRRGHGVLAMGNFYGPVGGAAREVFQDSQLDIEGAVAFLRERGHEQVGLIGHSYGAAASGYYASTHPDVAVCVLLSGSLGGPDTIRNNSVDGRMAGTQHDEVLAEARRLIAEGRPDDYLLLPGWYHLITARAFAEHGVPELLEYVRRVRCPLLALRGELESPENLPVERVAQLTAGPSEWVIIPGADHFYGGQEREVSEAVAGWLSRVSQPGEAAGRQYR